MDALKEANKGQTLSNFDLLAPSWGHRTEAMPLPYYLNSSFSQVQEMPAGSCHLRTSACDWAAMLTSVDYLETVLDWEAWALIGMALGVLCLAPNLFALAYRPPADDGHGGHDPHEALRSWLCAPAALRSRLVDEDNHAIGVSLSGFLLGLGLVLEAAIADFGVMADGPWGGVAEQHSTAGAAARRANLARAALAIAMSVPLLFVSQAINRRALAPLDLKAAVLGYYAPVPTDAPEAESAAGTGAAAAVAGAEAAEAGAAEQDAQPSSHRKQQRRPSATKRKSSLDSGVVSAPNLAAGIVEGGSFVAAGLCISGSVKGMALAGPGAGDCAAVVLLLFVISQVALAVLCGKCRSGEAGLVDVSREVGERRNEAAAVAHAGRCVAVACLVRGATVTSPELPTLAVWLAAGFALLLAMRWLVDELVLPATAIRREIHEDRNWGVALLAGAFEVAIASCLSSLLPSPCQGGFDNAADYVSFDLGAKLSGTRFLSTLWSADRLVATLAALEVLVLSKYAFSAPFLMRHFHFGTHQMLSFKNVHVGHLHRRHRGPGKDGAGGDGAVLTRKQAAGALAGVGQEGKEEEEEEEEKEEPKQKGAAPATSAATASARAHWAIAAAKSKSAAKLHLIPRFDLNDMVTQRDNYAICISYAGYVLALGSVVAGATRGALGADLQEDRDAADVAFASLLAVSWAFMGAGLLVLAHYVCDWLLLRRFASLLELKHGNKAVGCAEAGIFVASGQMLASAIEGRAGTRPELWQDYVFALLAFALSQALLVAFAALFQCRTAYDNAGEVKKRNCAAGVNFGLHLVAVGTVASRAFAVSDALPTFFAWAAIGVAGLFVMRFVVDYVVLSFHRKVDDEILHDRNWGVALASGAAALSVALIFNTALRRCPYANAMRPSPILDA